MFEKERARACRILVERDRMWVFRTAAVGHGTTVARVEIKLRVEISSVKPSISSLRRVGRRNWYDITMGCWILGGGRLEGTLKR